MHKLDGISARLCLLEHSGGALITLVALTIIISANWMTWKGNYGEYADLHTADGPRTEASTIMLPMGGVGGPAYRHIG